MSHEGAPTGSEEVKNQEITSETYYGGEVPEFNPDHAEELKQESIKSNEIAEKESPSIETSEDRLNLNRDTYNDVARRRAFLKSQYPDMQNAPQSIANEYANCGFMMTYLDRGVSAATSGSVLKDSVGGEQVVVDAFHRDQFDEAARQLTSLAAENSSLVDANAEKNFQLPKVNVEAYAQRIEQAATPEEVNTIMEEAQKLSQDVDMDTMYALHHLSGNAEAKMRDLHETSTTQNKRTELQLKVQSAEAALASARDAWKNAGPFKKIGMRIRGENNFSILEKNVTDAQDELAQFENQHPGSAAA